MGCCATLASRRIPPLRLKLGYAQNYRHQSGQVTDWLLVSR